MLRQNGISAIGLTVGGALILAVLTIPILAAHAIAGSVGASGNCETSKPGEEAAIVPCFGDCNGDGQVTVDEIILLVEIALGNVEPSTCLPFLGQPIIQVIMSAIEGALNGCPV